MSSIGALLRASAAVHAVLILYSAWHDSRAAVKYTDVDYWVFWDAALNWIRQGSPYGSSVYRYSPAIAALMVPFVWLHEHAPAGKSLARLGGKVLFSMGDLAAGYFIYRILRLQGTSRNWSLNLAGWLWLLNPMIVAISTRGNAEGVVCAFVLGYVYVLLKGRLLAAAALLGIVTHLKIFPLIYGMPVAFYLLRRKRLGQLLAFFAVSAGVFAACTAATFVFFGLPGLQSSLLYHLSRSDVRHNFSPYFYPFYLLAASGTTIGRWQALASFAPQLLSVAALAYKYSESMADVGMACFAQTAAFVTFNKVVTSQYFVWYLCLLPIVLLRMGISLSGWLLILAAWYAAQGAWLASAYRLEFTPMGTHHTYKHLWLAGLAKVVVDAKILQYMVHRFDGARAKEQSKTD